MSYRPRIKICGITDPLQAEEISKLGIDALGLIVGADASKRKISLSQAEKIIAKIPPFISKVALVVNQPTAKITEIITQLDIDYIQFHGDESSDFCNQFNFPYIRCLRVKNHQDVSSQISTTLKQGAKAVLLDAWDEKQYGGTGKQIVLPNALNNLPQPFILAGGISADNAVLKVKELQPYALDINSGVEISPGNKDVAKIRLLMHNINQYLYKFATHTII